MPIFQDRAYRKELTSAGLIYFGGVEHPIRVLNISLSGVLLALKCDATVHNINDIFATLQLSTSVDIYLPDVHLAGQASMVRVELVEGGFQLGIEFRELTFDIDTLMFNRRAYRKPVVAHGLLNVEGRNYDFLTENASIDGLKIKLAGYVEVEPAQTYLFECAMLGLQGQSEVVWVSYSTRSTFIGLQFKQLTQDDFKGIPRFVRSRPSLVN